MTEIIESDSVELEPVSDRTVLGVADPAQALAATERFAKALKAKIDAGNLAHRIGNQDYLGIEALAMAATALGVVGVVVETRKLENGWEAIAQARTLSGQVVGAGESMCTRDESRWSRKADFELRGMAQTRALSRALRGPVGSMVSLASYSVTSAEEIDAPTVEPEPAQLPSWAKPVADVAPAARALVAILEAAGVPEPAKAASRIGQRIFDRCDTTVPVCVLAVLRDIVDVALQPAEAS